MNFELLEEKANDGDLSAIRQLVECYKNGIGVEQDLGMAEQWVKMLPDVDENFGEDSFADGEMGAGAQNGAQLRDVGRYGKIENKTEHQDQGQLTPYRERSWKEIRHELEKMNFITLEQVVARGNYLAELIVGERYLKSSRYDEQMNGAGMVREAIEHIKNGEVGAASAEAIKDALSEGWTMLARLYLKKYDDHPDFGEKAFEASSNAFEIDHSNVEGIITCYKKGIGCYRDERKIDTYKRYKAEAGGIIERYKYAKSLGDGSVVATEFFQKALESHDADEHPYYVSLVRLSLAERGEKDINGESIDVEMEKRIQNDLLNANKDPDVIEINRKLAEQKNKEEERQRAEKELAKVARKQKILDKLSSNRRIISTLIETFIVLFLMLVGIFICESLLG